MNVLALLRQRFAATLANIGPPDAALGDLVLPSQDPRFGDYQANCAMPLGKRLGKPPRDVATDIVSQLDVTDCCHPPEIAGPGFINLRLRDDWLVEQLARAAADIERLGIEATDSPRRIIVDFSSPNVAKPMHVGHIRSTVIGDALYRILTFLGHQTTSDNHLGDWGTQFGMIIYGFKHFVDEAAMAENPVRELGRLYRITNQLVEYHRIREREEAQLEDQLRDAQRQLEWQSSQPAASEKQQRKKQNRLRQQLQSQVTELEARQVAVREKRAAVEEDPQLATLAAAHPRIEQQVLEETARLHAGDETNVALWQQFMPACLEEIEATYRRLGVSFDHTLGESFYQNRLAHVVASLADTGIATASDGAMCVFLEGEATPLIVQKKDGAFLYATTDLATIEYRWQEFRPDTILYVVDHRQALHFSQLFATARRWGYDQIDFQHVSFGTVLGEDGKPFKTRSGDTVGLRGLLDEAVERALAIVTENDEQRPVPLLNQTEREAVAETVGIGAIKYADLSHNRTSDYVFSYGKMLAMNGNTAAYLQYSYARVQSIFDRGGVDVATIRNCPTAISLEHPAERALAIEIVRFAEALQRVASDYRPNHLTSYLFQLAGRFAEFFENCPVLKAEAETLRGSRLQLCDLAARTIVRGLDLLGIGVSERM